MIEGATVGGLDGPLGDRVDGSSEGANDGCIERFSVGLVEGVTV